MGPEVEMFALVRARVAPRRVPTRHLSRTSPPYAPRPLNVWRVAAPHNLNVSPAICAPAAATMPYGLPAPDGRDGFSRRLRTLPRATSPLSSALRARGVATPPALRRTRQTLHLSAGPNGRPRSPHIVPP